MAQEQTIDETSTPLEVDEIELVLRRFAAEQKDSALMSLIQSMFTESAMDKVKHETASGDVAEDKKEEK